MKPSTSDGYDPATTLQAKATCLYVATKLGDLMDEIVVVGGLVPSLLVPQDVGVHLDAHIGTMDVDLALRHTMWTYCRRWQSCARTSLTRRASGRTEPLAS